MKAVDLPLKPLHRQLELTHMLSCRRGTLHASRKIGLQLFQSISILLARVLEVTNLLLLCGHSGLQACIGRLVLLHDALTVQDISPRNVTLFGQPRHIDGQQLGQLPRTLALLQFLLKDGDSS